MLRRIEANDFYGRDESLRGMGIWQWATEDKISELLIDVENWESTIEHALDFNEVRKQ